jgi:hypothetical protein
MSAAGEKTQDCARRAYQSVEIFKNREGRSIEPERPIGGEALVCFVLQNGRANR